MFSKSLPSLLFVFIVNPLLTNADCPTTSVANIPGCWGEPGCAYVIAGDGQDCNFDYCNCGGIAAPLLPSTVDGTPTLGCGSYTTKPTAKDCPTAKPTLPGGGGGSSPATVTAEGPISTAFDAFRTDASAPTVTTFSYQGGAFTYTRATFTSLSAQEDTKTITATVTKTQGADSALQTFIGPIVVGPHGIFWGPPGTAPDCIWPFCTQSGPPGGNNGGGGAGGNFGCQDCVGGGGTNGIGGGSGGGEGGGDSGEGEGEGEGEEEGKPPPESCPAGKKVKRSSFSLVGGRLFKRAEEAITSTNPLKDALSNFGIDKQGSNLAIAAIDSAEGILTNKFPDDKPNAYVTGLEGHYMLTKKTVIGTGINQQTFQSRNPLFWRIRWDFEPDQFDKKGKLVKVGKGPHVNAQFGKNPSSKFAYQLDSSKFPDGNGKKAMNNIAKTLNKQCKYDMATNFGKEEPTWDTTKQQAIEDLKEFFKQTVNGPC
ncbi:DENN domain-containing protein 5A [Pseudocyphellaria aurata]|nr:DENN domain-containing protein 5A [Pseudocyphellaria aurata]